MEANLSAVSLVVIAHDFNVSIVNQHWLVKYGIVDEEDLKGESVITPIASQITTKDFSLTLLQDRLQLALKPDAENKGDLIRNKVGIFINELPQTPYSAVGFNFIWSIETSDVDMQEITSYLFAKESNPLYNHFLVEDARFGAYMSKNLFSGRFKLDIKPITIPASEKKEERIQLAFNAHYDIISDNKVSEIEDHLKKWEEVEDTTHKMTSELIDSWEEKK